MRTRADVLADTLALLNKLREDWDYDDEITETTGFLADLGFESLDVVILANTMQQKYGQVFPFTEFFTAVGKREHPDIALKEWVDFMYGHLKDRAEG